MIPTAADRGPKYGAAGKTASQAGLVLVVLSLIAGLITFLVLTGLTPIRPTHGVVITVLLVDLSLCIAMVAVITWQVRGIVQARREKEAGSRLHVRVLMLFGLIALLPALTLAVFAVISLDRGLDQLFSSKTKQIIENSLSVAESYVDEHGQVIRAEVVAMARDMEDELAKVPWNSPSVPLLLTSQAQLRQLPMAYLIDGNGKQKVSAQDGTERIYRAPPIGAIQDAGKGQAVVISPGSVNLVGAVKKIGTVSDLYLYVARPVNASVVRQLEAARRGALEYSQLEDRRLGTQVAFALMYLVLALTFLLSAIWAGLAFADRLVTPIRRLMGAAQEVTDGNLDVQLPDAKGERDLKLLSKQFNKMTKQLATQRNELVETNEQLLERRQFIEAVLSGVTAGVIGLDDDGVIDLANPSAVRLLGGGSLVGSKLDEVSADFSALARNLDSNPRLSALHEQVEVMIDGVDRHFAVQVTKERDGGEALTTKAGMVVTFDDITELVSAQRTSAWADVARRIAHEIKNPLTPIQLSAERLKRKYGKVITEDKDVFDRCTETIIRQVGDIGRMVDEFSSFARMPTPEMAVHDIRNLVRESVFLFEVSNTRIALRSEIADGPVTVECDARLIGQALTNLVKNATEAIEARMEDEDEDYQGEVVAALSVEDGNAVIRVMDNGIGLPANRQRLLEPYMTTREKGTGLGLAIVHKVIEQHGGRLYLEDAPVTSTRDHGACMRVVLPLAEADARSGTEENSDAHSASGLESKEAAE